MPDVQTLGPWLRRFFEEYLVSERNLARNTQLSYRDTFKLLLAFAADRLRKPAERLVVRELSPELALAFLAHLEDRRGCSPQTRNQRLTALRAFARFVGGRSPPLTSNSARRSALCPSRKRLRSRSRTWKRPRSTRYSPHRTAPHPKAAARASCCCSCTTREPGRTKRPRCGSAICS